MDDHRCLQTFPISVGQTPSSNSKCQCWWNLHIFLGELPALIIFPLDHYSSWVKRLNIIWLVVLTILKNASQWEGLSHILWKIKNVWNHQPVMKPPFVMANSPKAPFLSTQTIRQASRATLRHLRYMASTPWEHIGIPQPNLPSGNPTLDSKRGKKTTDGEGASWQTNMWSCKTLPRIQLMFLNSFGLQTHRPFHGWKRRQLS